MEKKVKEHIVKKIKKEENSSVLLEQKPLDAELIDRRIWISLNSPDGNQLGERVELSLNTTTEELQGIVNQLLENDENLLYSFFYETTEIKKSLNDFVKKMKNFTTETIFNITYHPQSLFFVRPITRSSSSLPGHTESVLSVAFSPDSKNLASGSGDKTIRLWDIGTETPNYTGEVHTNWVLVVAWAPNGKMLASGGMDNQVVLWDPETGKQIGKAMKGHSKWITSIAWEPVHKDPTCRRLASSSKDTTIRVWDSNSQDVLYSLSGHSACVTKVLWGGQNMLYSASEDRIIKVWNADGVFVRDLKGHGHWVNTLSLSTDYALRTGPFDEKGTEFSKPEDIKEAALKKYNKIIGEGFERLASGSDDFTLFLWDPVKKSSSITRMTGHQKLVNHIAFSPDGRFLISASFDNGLKLWDGYNGSFLANFRGHVGPVYQVAWSGDSRLLVSASKDSTMKVWDIKTKKLMFDLPGHSDEIYAVDWSADGEKVCSGGKDRLLKIWRN